MIMLLRTRVTALKKKKKKTSAGVSSDSRSTVGQIGEVVTMAPTKRTQRSGENLQMKLQQKIQAQNA